MLDSDEEMIKYTDMNGNTLLHLAVKEANLDFTDLLL